MLEVVILFFMAYFLFRRLRNKRSGSSGKCKSDQNSSRGLYEVGSFGLHEEIDKFYASIHANGTECRKREDAVRLFADYIASRNPGSISVKCIGSTITSTFLCTSDIDVVVKCDGEMCRRKSLWNPAVWLGKFHKQLSSPLATNQWTDFELLTCEGLPFLRANDVKSGIKLNITCSTDVVSIPDLRINGTEWTNAAFAKYPDAPKLVTIVKELLDRRGLLAVRNGGISSFVVILLVVSLFQHTSTAAYNLGDLLLKFLRFYGRDFDHDQYAIIISDNGKIINKRSPGRRLWCQSPNISIDNPVEPGKDAADSSSNGWEAAKLVFERAYFALNEKADQSVFKGCSPCFLDVIF